MKRNRDLIIGVSLLVVGFVGLGILGLILLRSGPSAEAQVSPPSPVVIEADAPTSPPVPSVVGVTDEPTVSIEPTNGIELQPILVTIVTNGLEDTAQTTTALLESMHETFPQLADVFQHCTYNVASFQSGETIIELTERGSVWVADDKADFRNLILTQNLNGGYKVALFIRDEMIYDLDYISNLNLQPGMYRLVSSLSGDIEAEFTDGGVDILSAKPNKSFNEQLTMMICKSY
jgi:hypothetical protein